MKRYRAVLWPVATLLLASLIVARLAPLDDSRDDASVLPVTAPASSVGDAPGPARATPPDNDADDAAEPRFDCGPVPEATFVGHDASVPADSSELDYLEDVARVLSHATDAEHLLTAAMLAPAAPTDDRDRLMAAALRADPDHPLVLWNALRHCRGNSGAPHCSAGLLERQAIAVDGDNGALWSRLSAHRYERGDMRGALEALERVATSPDFDLYLFDHVRLFERSLAAASNQSNTDRSLHAFGIAAASSGDEFRISGHCREMANGSSALAFEWRHACLRAGQRLERDSSTLVGMLIGTGIQISMLEFDGDDEAVRLVEQRGAALSGRYDSLNSADVNLLLAKDAAVQADYLDVAEAHGELAALEFVAAEVERLTAIPGYDPCAG